VHDIPVAIHDIFDAEMTRSQGCQYAGHRSSPARMMHDERGGRAASDGGFGWQAIVTGRRGFPIGSDLGGRCSAGCIATGQMLEPFGVLQTLPLAEWAAMATDVSGNPFRLSADRTRVFQAESGILFLEQRPETATAIELERPPGIFAICV
jgi:hypothetical protein